MKRLLLVLLLLFVLIVAILLGAQNNQYIVINYLIAQSEMRVSMVMAVMVLIGVVLSAGIFSLFWLRLKWRIRQLERKLKVPSTDHHS